MGGNESKNIYVYNLETDKWTKAGELPLFHLVTEQINCVYNERQTITAYVQVDFEVNKFMICAASNGGVYDDKPWTWVFRETIDIENFHFKSITIIENKMIFLARGRPRDVQEQCCSFILIMPLIIKDGVVTGLDKNYKYIKLDPVVYPEFKTKPFVQRQNDSTVIQVLQENNFSDTFPRQLLEITVPDDEFWDKDSSLIDTKF